MKHVFTSHPGDEELYLEFYDRVKKLTNEELIESYNRQAKSGMFGVHAQAVYILALHKVFLERFGKCPVRVENDFVMGLTGRVDSIEDV